MSIKGEFSVSLNSTLSPYWREFKDTIGGIVLGQERAVQKIIRSLVVLESGLQGSRPISPLLFVGPPGSGKSYLAKMIAELWLGKASKGQVEPLVMISGETYSESHEGATLKGSPPGYVGHEDKSPLEDIGVFDKGKLLASMLRMSTEIIEEIKEENPDLKNFHGHLLIKPDPGRMSISDLLRYFTEHLILPELSNNFGPFRSVLLIDEFEKINPDVQKQFLGIFDTGKFAMMNGRTVDFRACLIILTGNIGTELITRELDGGGIGFHARKSKTEGQNQRIYELVRNKVKKDLDPAIYSRIGHEGITVFHALSQEDYAHIINIEIRATEKNIQGQSDGTFRIHTTPAFRKFLLSLADTPREGAREINRIIFKQVQEPLASLTETKQLLEGDKVRFGMNGGVVTIQRIPHPGSKRNPISLQREGDWQDETQREVRKKLNELVKDMLSEFYGRSDPEAPFE